VPRDERGERLGRHERVAECQRRDAQRHALQVQQVRAQGQGQGREPVRPGRRLRASARDQPACAHMAC